MKYFRMQKAIDFHYRDTLEEAKKEVHSLKVKGYHNIHIEGGSRMTEKGPVKEYIIYFTITQILY